MKKGDYNTSFKRIYVFFIRNVAEGWSFNYKKATTEHEDTCVVYSYSCRGWIMFHYLRKQRYMWVVKIFFVRTEEHTRSYCDF